MSEIRAIGAGEARAVGAGETSAAGPARVGGTRVAGALGSGQDERSSESRHQREGGKLEGAGKGSEGMGALV